MTSYRQFHNQPSGSPLDRWLSAMWATVSTETAGLLSVRVCPRNDGIAGGDPQALQMLLDGKIEFYTLMGGLLGSVAPVVEIQNVPFAFRDHAHVFEAMDGALGDHLRDELAAKGISMVPRACFENGFRHITTRTRPIASDDDLVDFFESLGARPVTTNLNRLYDALRTGDAVEAQENPLVMIEVNRLYEVQTYVSLTGHMWSGFNLLANLGAWRALPEDVREVVERVASRFARLQRSETDAENARLVTKLVERGLILNAADMRGARRRLDDFYVRWKREFGAKAWSLLEAQTGPLAP